MLYYNYHENKKQISEEIFMNDYIIFTDSACDIAPEILEAWKVKCINLTFTFESDGVERINSEVTAKEFYQKMRDGDVARTSAANIETFKDAFKGELENGKDILYLAFSSGLSTTYNSGRMAVNELSEDYPDRKIMVVDTLSASAGFGLLVHLAVEKRDKGLSIEEVAEFIEDTKLHLCHWFTVDDLQYLKRGGRVSPTVAFVGGLLGIKPVLHMDNEGHLINMSKVRGRAAALKALVDKFGELAVDNTKGPVYISNGDCMEDVETVKNMLITEYGVEVELITDIGPVIGAHSGPGTIAVFFIGKER
jgi:DegV family protein with EDD domain